MLRISKWAHPPLRRTEYRRTAARSTAPPILQLQVLLAAAGSCGDGMFLPHSGNVPLADPHAGSDFCDPGRLRAHTLASPRLPNQSGL